MRISSIAVLISIVVSSSIPAFAFYPSGSVNKDISYSNIELIQQSYSVRVTGTLSNKTNKPIKLNGKILFVTIHKDVLNSATIYETIPPHGSVQFDRHLKKNNFKRIKHCYKLEWEVKDYSRERSRSKSTQSKPKRESIGYSNTRASDSYISITGKGNHNSDQFRMRTGLYIAKVSHTGKYHCGIKLLHSDGTHAELITNEIGYIVESKAVRIDEDGYYLLDVSADGDWTVSMEYQKPKTVQQEKTADLDSTTQVGDSRGASNPVVIKLKNGRTMKADSYWEEGDKLKVSIYGGIMSVSKKDVDEIIDTAPVNEAKIVTPSSQK